MILPIKGSIAKDPGTCSVPSTINEFILLTGKPLAVTPKSWKYVLVVRSPIQGSVQVATFTITSSQDSQRVPLFIQYSNTCSSPTASPKSTSNDMLLGRFVLGPSADKPSPGRKVWVLPPMIRSIAEDTFTKSGYSKINISRNGKELLDKLLEIKSLCRTKNKSLSSYIDVLITDIEMPQIDGMFLIKKIREDSLLATLPVVVFSSISDNQIKEKTKRLGANFHVPKPKIEELIHTVDELIRLNSK